MTCARPNSGRHELAARLTQGFASVPAVAHADKKTRRVRFQTDPLKPLLIEGFRFLSSSGSPKTKLLLLVWVSRCPAKWKTSAYGISLRAYEYLEKDPAEGAMTEQFRNIFGFVVCTRKRRRLVFTVYIGRTRNHESVLQILRCCGQSGRKTGMPDWRLERSYSSPSKLPSPSFTKASKLCHRAFRRLRLRVFWNEEKEQQA